MADTLFDRTVFNPRERPLSTDQNQLQSQLAAGQFDILERMMMPRAASSLLQGGSIVFHAGGFAPVALSGMTLALVPGVGMVRDPTMIGTVGGISGVNDTTTCYPLYLAAAQSFAVPTANATNPRIDIIEVKLDRRLENPLTRDVFDPALEVFNPTLLNKTLAYGQYNRTSINGSGSLNYKTGTPAGSPTAPTVTSGYYKIAEVYVGAGVTSITQRNIADWRRIAGQPMFSARVIVHNDVVTTPKLQVADVVCTPGFNITLVVADAAPAVVGQSARVSAYIGHPSLQGSTFTISPNNNLPVAAVGFVDITSVPNAGFAAGSALIDIFDGTTAGYTVWSSVSSGAPFVGLGQELMTADLFLLTAGGGAFGALSDFTLTIRAQST
jgi:hypothetical protein